MPDSLGMQREIEHISTGANDASCTFHNGSVIRVVVSNDNARSARAHVIIVDEFRQVDFSVISTVLRKFLSTPRQCGYHSNPEYSHIQERNKELYLSSCWLKSHWSWERAKAYFESMVDGKKYFICSLPYQLAIKEGLLMREQVEDEMGEADFSPVGWLMEMEALYFGENEKSYFKFEELNKNRAVDKAFYPLEIAEHVRDKKIELSKQKDEIRVVSVDVAARGGKHNDATAISCTRLIPTNDGYERQVVYSEAFEAGIVTEQSIRVKQLYNDFSADYLVLDTQNMGIFLLDVLGQSQIDSRNGEELPPLKCMNDSELAERCVYPDAPQVIYSIRATAKLNSQIATSMKNSLRRNKLRFLIHENESEEFLLNIKGYENLPDDLKLEFKMPFVQASLFINETINLEATYNDLEEVTLRESGSTRKDRYSSISYMNYFADVLELKNRKVQPKTDIKKLFRFRQGKLM